MNQNIVVAAAVVSLLVTSGKRVSECIYDFLFRNEYKLSFKYKYGYKAIPN